MDYTQSHEVPNKMTQDVFNWMARSVNKDLVQLGYPTILIKKGSRDFVSLCALMQNCSSLLAVVRAKGAFGTSAPVADINTSGLTTASTMAAGKASVTLHADSQQKKRAGLFSSSKCFKQLQVNNVDSDAKLNSKEQRTMQFERDEFASVYDQILNTVRRDTELIICETRCLGTELVLSELGDQQPKQHSQQRNLAKDSLALYFATRWVQFREAVIQRLLEGNRQVAELQTLRSFPVKSPTTEMTRSKSFSGDMTAGAVTAAGIGSDSCGFCSESIVWGHRSHYGRSSRQRSQSHISVTMIPSLEAEIRRLKLELTRREQRRKEDADRHAKERDRMSRDLCMAQRRSSIGTPRWSAGRSNQQIACYCGDQQAIPEILQTLDRLAESLGGGVHRSPTSLNSSGKQQHQAHVDRVCSSILTRVQGLQADYNTSRRRQADLEVLISVLKTRLNLTNDQLSDVSKFESAVNDIARKMVSGADSSGGGGRETSGTASSALRCSDEHRDSLVSRLTSRLRERQRPV